MTILRGTVGILLALLVTSCGDDRGGIATPTTASRTVHVPADGSTNTAITKAEFEQPTMYAGAVRRPDGHYVVFAAAHQVGNLRDFIRLYVDDDAAYQSIEFIEKRWSYVDLHETQLAVMADEWLLDQGINVTGAGMDPEKNKVNVFVEEYTESAAAIVIDRYGDDRLYVSPKSEPPAVAD